jgi:hypothetical protein
MRAWTSAEEEKVLRSVAAGDWANSSVVEKAKSRPAMGALIEFRITAGSGITVRLLSFC